MIGLVAGAVLALPTASHGAEIAVGISVRVGPPPLPVYTQPICPGPDYIWTPGYWAYDPDNGYYWVPGTWVMAPTPGFLWTPGYWGWGGSAFVWHMGYWGPHVGFYGGINYGFGYPGVGFVGGEWRGRTFFYNRSVNNINITRVTNVYDRRVTNNFAVNRVSYNGGAGGLGARPGREELAAEHDRHFEATSIQRQHEMTAHGERSQFASENHGRPGVAATARPGEFRGQGAVQSKQVGSTGNPGGFHGAQHGTTSGYSGGRSPNPGGGGNHQVMTAHPTTSSSQGYGSRQGGTATGQNHGTPQLHQEGSPHGQYHNAPAPHSEVVRPNNQTTHQTAAQQHGSQTSGGGHERHQPEPRH
jgi:hypothetical protein